MRLPQNVAVMLATAGTIELAGQGWAMPVRLHETLDEGTHMALVPPEQTTPLGMPPPLLALKAGIQVSPAQDLLNSRRRGTLDTGCELPLELSGHHGLGNTIPARVYPAISSIAQEPSTGSIEVP